MLISNSIIPISAFASVTPLILTDAQGAIHHDLSLAETAVSERASRSNNSRSYINELVVNWHLTEACNFRCRYCYAKWERPEERKDLCRDEMKTTGLLADLRAFFDPGNVSNPLSNGLRWDSVRLSLAGGEPTLYQGRLPAIVRQASDMGFRLSLITNGSLLDMGAMKRIVPHLSMLGLSVDSSDASTNKRIGRADRNGDVLGHAQVAELLDLARQLNPELIVKVNTVVNAANCNEDMTEWIQRMSPDRWKVLRVLPVISNALTISDRQFSEFLSRHSALSATMSVEDNAEMTDSYIMVDPHGRFFQNSKAGKGRYVLSEPINTVGASTAFSQIKFDAQKFAGRYR